MSSIQFKANRKSWGNFQSCAAFRFNVKRSVRCRSWEEMISQKASRRFDSESLIKFTEFSHQRLEVQERQGAGDLDGDLASCLRSGDVGGETGFREGRCRSLRLVILDGGLDGVLSEHWRLIISSVQCDKLIRTHWSNAA